MQSFINGPFPWVADEEKFSTLEEEEADALEMAAKAHSFRAA